MNAAIANVRPGTANTFEHMASNFKFRVAGDGKVEPELAERFKSAALVEDISDRRLKAFATSHDQLRQARLPYAENVKSTQDSLLATLGSGWKIDNLSGPGGAQEGSSGISTLQIEFDEPGAGSQSLTLQHYGTSELILKTSCQMGHWSVEHRIEGKLNGGALNSASILEGAEFQNQGL